MSDLIPDDYTATLEELKRQVHEARLRVQRKANTELLQLWWQIGRTIIDRQAEQGWGSKVLDRLAADLRAEFPSMTTRSTWRRCERNTNPIPCDTTPM